MNTKLLLVILFISPYFINCQGEKTCSSLFGQTEGNTIFDLFKQSKCNSLSVSDKERCFYDGTNCVSQYKNCADYTVSTGQTIVSSTCTGITPENTKKKCVVDGSQCKEVFKVCSDYTLVGPECSSLQIKEEGTPVDGQRCALDKNNKCGIHYNECSGVSSNENNACTNNIPSNAAKECEWDETCKSKDRGCAQYSEINTFYGNTKCSSLSHGENKKCVLKEANTCEEKASCSDYKESDSTECGNYVPIDAGKDNLDISDLYKCAIDLTKNPGQQCVETKKLCTEIGSGNNCEALYTYDLSKKRCFLSGTVCKEVYIGCSLGDDSNCTTTIPYKLVNNVVVEDVHSKCVFDTTCQLKDKECQDIADQATCLAHSFTDSRKNTKKCIYTGTTCKEVFQTCELYEQSGAINDAGCKEIHSSSDPYECIFTAAKTDPVVAATCKTKERECGSADGNSYLCQNIKANNSTYYCLFNSGECKEHHRECKTTSDRLECESNIPFDSNNKECILVHDSKCQLTSKETQQKYNYCSDLKENDSTKCSAIIPLTESGEAYTYSVKCGIKDSKCVLIEPECDGITNKLQCLNTKLKDSNKICVYTKVGGTDTCVEQYKNCATFEAHKADILEADRQAECEALIGQKCTYTNNVCSAKTFECKDFNPDFLEENECTVLTDSITDKSQKCVYTGVTCSQVKKTCAELSTFSSSVKAEEKESVCSKAEVSETDKKCIVKSDGSGCQLVDKSQQNDASTTPTSTTPGAEPGPGPATPSNNQGESNNGSENGNGNDENGNAAEGQYLNKVFIFLLCLLI